MQVTDKMAETAARILNKRLAEGNLFGVSREMLEAALSAAPAASGAVPVAWTTKESFEALQTHPKMASSMWGKPNGLINVPLFASPPLPKEDGLREESPNDIRNLGWTVAVHNDYRLNGEQFTFWLFTKSGRAVKGEGRTDAEALNAVRAALQSEDGK